jgi:hypothetical protein
LFALSRFGKIEFAKVGKNGEIGEGDEENNKICVFLDKSTKNISVFLDKMAKKICVTQIKCLFLHSKSDTLEDEKDIQTKTI